MKYILNYLFFFLFNYIQGQTYKELQRSDFHPSRIRQFYKKAVSMLSQDRLYASLSFYGVGAFANKDYKANDVAMEIPGNYTIASFDETFPYFDQIEDILIENRQRIGLVEENTLRILLNLNYLRYVNNTNRFFKIYFDNLPKQREYLPFWDNQDKALLKKLINDPLIEKDLFYRNITESDIVLEKIKRKLRHIDPNLNTLMLTDAKVEEGLNTIFTRSVMISYKGWKVINNMTKKISEEDLYNIGWIIIPGADAINYERIIPENKNVEDGQVKFEKGKVVIKAGRKFKKGEEFKINYDPYATVYDLFKRYGFVPLESLNNNMVFKLEVLNMTQAPKEARLVCLALNACLGDRNDVMFSIPKFTNAFSLPHLNIERLNHWFGHPFTENKMMEIYDSIVNMRHSNITEGMALSKFANSFYGFLIYSTHFKTDIKTLLEMYEENQNHVSVKKIIESRGIKIKIEKEHEESNERFREILKYCLLHQHIVAINTKESIERLNKTLDNELFELRQEIVEQFS